MMVLPELCIIICLHFGLASSDSASFTFYNLLVGFEIVLGFHCSHNQDDGGIGGLGHIGPAGEGDRVEGLGKASKLGFRRHADVYMRLGGSLVEVNQAIKA